MLYVIAYDVTGDGRRRRVSKYLTAWGRRIQKSAFECDLTQEEIDSVMQRLRDLLDDSRDRCHVYRICAGCRSLRTVVGSDLEPPMGRVLVV